MNKYKKLILVVVTLLAVNFSLAYGGSKYFMRALIDNLSAREWVMVYEGGDNVSKDKNKTKIKAHTKKVYERYSHEIKELDKFIQGYGIKDKDSQLIYHYKVASAKYKLPKGYKRIHCNGFERVVFMVPQEYSHQLSFSGCHRYKKSDVQVIPALPLIIPYKVKGYVYYYHVAINDSVGHVSHYPWKH